MPRYTVTFQKVTPGLPLPPAEADPLRVAISTRAESLFPNISINTLVKDMKFDDKNGDLRLVSWKVLDLNNADLAVELISYK